MTMNLTRRAVLGGFGALTVSVVLPGMKARAAVFGAATQPPLKPENLSSYIKVNADGTVSAFWGKMDMGQGTDLGVAQMVAEELDLPVSKVFVQQGDTATSINQGGASGSTGIQNGGKALQSAAAEARYQLVEMASRHLGVPAADLKVDDGVVSVAADPAKKVTYTELIGGRFFDTQLEWNEKIGNALFVKGKGAIKPVADHKVIGTSPMRRDVPRKVLGTGDYVVDIKVDGMLHARVIRPEVAGALPLEIDESSVQDIPGVQVIREKGFLAVVAPKEWDAIKAAEQLKVSWSDSKPNFPTQTGVHDHLRKAAVVHRDPGDDVGNVDAAFAGAAKVIEAAYEWPFQSHASMGPACAVVEIKGDKATLWTGSQKPHFAAAGVAAILGLPAENVHGIWVPGPGSYGRNDAGDAAADAALIAKLTGRPIRVQGMRRDGTGWDPKGPASIHTARVALDDGGNVLAWHFESKGFSRVDVNSNESAAYDTLAGQLIDTPLQPGEGFGVPEESYGFPAKRKAWETVAPLLDRASPLRTSHLRDPVGPQIHFASESFLDEVAYDIGMDPVAFRLKYLTDPRDIAVVKAATEKAGWRPRTAARRQSAGGDTLRGQGMAYAQRSGTRVAIVSEVEINSKTGEIWARKFTVAHDCGMIINPRQLTHTIEGNIVQGISRAVHEEVQFDENIVTSVDWETYPILDITETPETIDVVLIDRKDIAPSGAGEPSMRPVAAAIANAIYDATGVRIRQAPFTPDKLRAAGLT
ncbi:xanthine dehydrogenase family protein molybdopterin-binding subunit [Rhizobium sp. P32RR-XVIII]|uniref:xanthine dehydrogenase family protein molybdopterin-binding subunit n=1 Tax=Rhizobium sp. P32RR-XVIII TaxID=2726738 RepID=UPI001456FE69|nr:molybdopterin cofactor-binding domain-containing protein [Rhizobium sp. P32RR-XVIII]NLS04153.1 xanthine dehydrogenase family protein molybdopterin-binding subunit [Rhizobium sp. P32RR-XVIII]